MSESMGSYQNGNGRRYAQRSPQRSRTGSQSRTESQTKYRMKPRNPRNERKRRRKKKMSEDEFRKEPLERFIIGEHYDIAKSICRHFDNKLGDTDTVAIVARKGRGPKLSYWSKGEYQRKHRDLNGKYVF